MRSRTQKYHEAYRANVQAPWAGVLPVLSERLGISLDSLQALGVGFAPKVAFKNSESYGWWTIPERDAQGNIVGVSLRSDTGTKIMLPGSRHGLIYDVSRTRRTVSTRYSRGKHNWTRTLDVGIVCPVCSKPDGCLLSSENPEDPQAVLCIRESAGAVGEGDVDSGGWLHIRKTEGNLDLGTGDDISPVIVVEGMTDTGTAMDLGFEAVGRPSNLAGLAYLKEYLRGRCVWIIGENDIKPDGKHPGKTGMNAAFETLKGTCDCTKFLPPEGVNDLRQWKELEGLTRDELVHYAKTYGSQRSDSKALDSREPVSVAMRWLREEYYADDIPTLRKYEGQWYTFQDQCYSPVEEESCIRGGLYRWLLDRMYKEESDGGVVVMKPYNADKNKITNVIDALSMECPLRAEPPCWLDGRDGPDPKLLMGFPNGVLNIREYIEDGRVGLMPISPLYFTMNMMPYEFDPEAVCPQWEKFLGEALPDDPKKRHLLQEWCGYLLLPDTTQQKLMILNGVSGSGKTTALHAISAMLGERQTCHPSLKGLGERYGLAQCVGKLAAIINDAELDRSANRHVIMERLKEMTGSVHPRLEVRRMRVAETTMHLFARITIACNDLPDLPDSGGALPRRTLAIQFTEVFESATRQPDRQLPDKLAMEAPGILNWALVGLERLWRQERFTIPKSSEELAKVFSSNASPLTQFVDECCRVGSNETIAEATLYEAWRNWAREYGLASGMKLKFRHNLQLNVSSAKYYAEVHNGQKIGGFTGIALTKAARERYLG